LTDITEYGDIMINAYMDEWGRRKVDSLLEDGAKIIVVAVPVVPVVKKPIMKMDLGPHPRSRLLFAPTLMLKGAGAPSVPPTPTLWDSWDYLWVAVL
jgi:hypothetical protein